MDIADINMNSFRTYALLIVSVLAMIACVTNLDSNNPYDLSLCSNVGFCAKAV